MAEFLAVAIITCLAVISPGADFAMVTRNSLTGRRRSGILTAGGIALGVLLHVAYTLLGVAAIMSQTPQLYAVIKYIGAIYLLYLGYKTFTNTKPIMSAAGKMNNEISGWRYFRQGFFTNALNPKTTLFVLSTFLQVVNPQTPWLFQLGYGVFMSLAHFVWFSLVALFLTAPLLQDKIRRGYAWINRIVGCGLMILAGMMALP
ncbi:LysE family translocator [Brenneria izadpanahii]|uniref:LysE family translocator n=1 Tax=Brenneria izadpanahii TaxID=2722756 RepID=A0ABX7UXM6_9GAMM|nr:LysE family translocator [Brenneria izadpanahii]QTF08900.1 LysE family translocator [Brenneria izadpanahii]